MDCNDFKNNLPGYFRDALDFNVQYQMDEHLFQCEKCQKIFQIAELLYDRTIIEEPIKRIISEAVQSASEDSEIPESEIIDSESLNRLEPPEIESIKKNILKRLEGLKSMIAENIDISFGAFALPGLSLSSSVSVKPEFSIGSYFSLNIENSEETDLYFLVFEFLRPDHFYLAYPTEEDHINIARANDVKNLECVAKEPAGRHLFRIFLFNKESYRSIEPTLVSMNRDRTIYDLFLLSHILKKGKYQYIESNFNVTP